MKEETTRLSASLEDYLKEIYLLNLEGQEVRVTDIARSLGISKPSVNRAMNTLKELQLLEHEHYGKIILTESGSDMAKNILDTNKIIYRFLTFYFTSLEMALKHGLVESSVSSNKTASAVVTRIPS